MIHSVTRLTVLAACAFASVAHAEDLRCLDYADGKRLGEIGDKSLIEASGLAASELQPGVLWSHNDSRGDPLLFAIDEFGEAIARFEVDGAEAIDWEDVALGPCGAPEGWRDCLFIADTGNNDLDRKDQVVYRVPEPDAYSEADSTEPADAMGVVFPDDVDVEALFIDQQGALWFVAKRDGDARLYTTGPFEADTTVDARLSAERDDIDFVTGADATADGTLIILRGHRQAWELFRPKGRSVRSAFLGEALEVDLDKESQGEAIAYDPDGTGFYTTSEGKGAPIRWYRCKRFGATLTGKEDGLGIVVDPAQDPDAVCAGGGTSALGLVAPFVALMLMRRRSG